MLSLFLSFLSGAFYALAYWFPQWGWTVWLTQTPFFYALLKNRRPAWQLGLAYGLGFGLLFYLWAPGVVRRISGESGVLPVLFYFILILLFSIWPVLFGLGWHGLRKRLSRSDSFHSLWMIPTLWVVVEWLNMFTVPFFPWTKFQIGYRLAHHIHAIQLTSVTGIWGASFLVVTVNLLLAYAILKKKKSCALFASVLVLLIYGYGFITVSKIESKTQGQPVKLSLIQTNYSNSMEWNAGNGDSLVQNLFSLTREAIETRPAIIVWSETVLPWTFTPEDDFLLEMLKISWPAQAHHIMGMAVPVPNTVNKITNSALYIHPDGRISGQYDKEALLLFMERAVTLLRPLARMQLPLYRLGRYDNVVPGKRAGLLETRSGRVGVRICNEWLVPALVRESVRSGAGFLVNLSNDGDFFYNIMPDTHFDETRMRAVENRRDVAVACNRGVSGHISRSGRVIMSVKDTVSRCIPIALIPAHSRSFYSEHGDWLPWSSVVFILLFIARAFIQKRGK